MFSYTLRRKRKKKEERICVSVANTDSHCKRPPTYMYYILHCDSRNSKQQNQASRLYEWGWHKYCCQVSLQSGWLFWKDAAGQSDGWISDRFKKLPMILVTSQSLPSLGYSWVCQSQLNISCFSSWMLLINIFKQETWWTTANINRSIFEFSRSFVFKTLTNLWHLLHQQASRHCQWWGYIHPGQGGTLIWGWSQGRHLREKGKTMQG